MMEIVAIEVAVERDQPTLAEVHWDTQMMEVMEEMVVMTTHTTLIKAMTRADAPIVTGIRDTQYQWQYIHGTILWHNGGSGTPPAPICMNASFN